ncbi:MAG: hypothetical protein J6Y29_00685 [Clostridiales bacterium]|nr:hypothetical protein [Clostridiales bacterium]
MGAKSNDNLKGWEWQMQVIKGIKDELKPWEVEAFNMKEADRLIESAKMWEEELNDINKRASKIAVASDKELFLEENKERINTLKENIDKIYRLGRSFVEDQQYYAMNKDELNKKTPEQFIKQMNIDFKLVKFVNKLSGIFSELDNLPNVEDGYKKYSELENKLEQCRDEITDIAENIAIEDDDTWEKTSRYMSLRLEKLTISEKDKKNVEVLLERLTTPDYEMPKDYEIPVTISEKNMQEILDNAEKLKDDILGLESLRAWEMLGGENKDVDYDRKIFEKKQDIQELSRWEDKTTRRAKYEKEWSGVLQDMEKKLIKRDGSIKSIGSESTIAVDELSQSSWSLSSSKTLSSNDELSVDNEEEIYFDALDGEEEEVFFDALDGSENENIKKAENSKEEKTEDTKTLANETENKKLNRMKEILKNILTEVTNLSKGFQGVWKQKKKILYLDKNKIKKDLLRSKELINNIQKSKKDILDKMKIWENKNVKKDKAIEQDKSKEIVR